MEKDNCFDRVEYITIENSITQLYEVKQFLPSKLFLVKVQTI